MNSEEKSKNLFFSVGEPSGELHARFLVNELSKSPCLHTKISSFPPPSMGYLEVLKNYHSINEHFHKIFSQLERNPLDTYIFIDFSTFHLKLLERIQNLNLKIIYYIPPKIWAHGSHRLPVLQKTVSEIISIFPFEKDFFPEIPYSYFGNPLVDHIRDLPTQSRKGLCILPGSRPQEVYGHLDLFMKALTLLKRRGIQYSPVYCPLPLSWMSHNLSEKDYPGITFSYGDSLEKMKSSEIGWVCSGTATLEAVAAKLPIICIYKTHFINSLIAKSLLKVPYISLPNLIAHFHGFQPCISELLQPDPQQIVFESLRLYEFKEEISQKYDTILNLFPKGSLKRIADHLEHQN